MEDKYADHIHHLKTAMANGKIALFIGYLRYKLRPFSWTDRFTAGEESFLLEKARLTQLRTIRKKFEFMETFIDNAINDPQYLKTFID